MTATTKHKNDPLDAPVTERLCLARMQTLEERIEGLKKTVVAAATASTTILAAVQILMYIMQNIR